MLLGGDSDEAAKAPELLERALQIDPHSPKALFYGAVTAFQQGHLQVARERFAAMLALSPPESARAALQHQIDDIDAQLRDPGGAAAGQPAGSKIDAATAIHLHVTLSPSLTQQVPADASLFVFVRSPTGGPPLAVKRSAARLPQDVDLSAADAMVAGRSVQPGQNVSVVARISASGNALPQSGDLYGEIRYVAGKSGAQALQIDKLNP
jgi:cytochrome c-type biogenesis protein CcmH